MNPTCAGAVVILTVLIVVACGRCAHAADAAPLAPEPGESVLLLDEHTVARTQHLAQRSGRARDG